MLKIHRLSRTLIVWASLFCVAGARAGRGGHSIARIGTSEIFSRRGHGSDHFVFRPVRLRRRRGLRLARIRPYPRAARPSLDERCFPHHLGNLPNLPVAAGEVSGRSLGADRGVHDLLFHRPPGKTAGRSARHPGRPVFGILGSYGVAWYGIRINTIANSRALVRLAARQPAENALHSVAGRHEHRFAAHLRGTRVHDRHPGPSSPPNSPARASSASPSANRSGPRPCASAAASSPKLPTSAAI